MSFGLCTANLRRFTLSPILTPKSSLGVAFRTRRLRVYRTALRGKEQFAPSREANFVFQKGQSKGLNAVYHFTFKLQVSEGHDGQPDLRLTADTETWLRFLRKEANLVWALVRRKIRIQGSPKLLLAFGRCFPS